MITVGKQEQQQHDLEQYEQMTTQRFKVHMTTMSGVATNQSENMAK